MVDEKKESKYKREIDRKPIVLDMGAKKIAVMTDVTRNTDNGKIYKGVRVISGYEGQFGFVGDRYNSTIVLPSGLTVEELSLLIKAIREKST